MLAIPSCAARPSDLFKTDANNWLSGFRSEQAVKSKTEFIYSDTGSVAYSQPIIDAADADKAVSEYYQMLKSQFTASAKTNADKLFISYHAYSAPCDIFGIEVVSSRWLDGVQTQTVRCFNIDKNGIYQPDTYFKRLAKVQIESAVKSSSELADAVSLDKLTEYNSEHISDVLLFKQDGITAVYPENTVAESQVSVDVPYTKMYFALPDDMKGYVAKPEGRQLDMSGKMVALTFDDGPNGVHTNEILDTLEEYNCVATFFDVGNLIGTYPETVARAASLGCEMATHSWSHKNLKKATREEIEAELNKSREALKSVIGKYPTLMRPPGGAVGDILREVCSEYMIGWSVDTRDWESRDCDKVIESVKREGNLDGDIVLMHAIYGSTAKAVKELVPWLIENGYQLVTVSELMEYRFGIEMEKGVYYSALRIEELKSRIGQ